MKHIHLLILLSSCQFIFAQSGSPQATTAEERMQGFILRKEMEEKSILSEIKFKNVGPTVFSGRVVDIEVSPKDPSIFYVAYASGGLWKTTNNGTTFLPVFDHEMVLTIGDLAINWEHNIIWLGTGESNSSRSSYAGNGIYRSDNDGESWQHLGLDETHHTGRIILHPSDKDVAWAAMVGHLYSPNVERGIYRTSNGGHSWQKTLFVDENTGGIDLVIHPENPDNLFAAMWQKTRRAWDFTEAGVGSGIYKSADGGKTWSKCADGINGFPVGEGVGRIGLSLMVENGSTHIYAILDNYFRREPEKEDDDELTKAQLKVMSKTSFLALDKKTISTFLKQNRFPKKYNYEKVIQMIKSDLILPIALAEYLEDANSLLFDTPVIGAEVYHSQDLGKTWAKTHDDYLDRVYNSYGYYFGQIRVSPADHQKLYVMGVPILRSDDGGANWISISDNNVHSDHHDLWVNPTRAGHLINGNDGGINISYDDGANWLKCNSPSVGQYYDIAIDMEEPYNIYGGTQDNGVWVGPSDYETSVRWHSSGAYPYKSLLGGDGMQVQVDWRDNNTVYAGFQFGNYFRINRKSRKRTSISPKHELGERPLRFNWQSPIHLSRHNQDILYLGSNKLHRSLNQGDDWQSVSADLTKGGRKGDVAYGTLTTVDESPLQFGLLYVGSDDGIVHHSPDGGITWNDISGGLPEEMWISRIQASVHVKERVYIALNGYRWDDFNAYIFMSDDHGKQWKAIGNGLPLEPVNVIIEDPENEEIIYVGTDHGVYISLDLGETYHILNGDLPAVPVHDLVVHPEGKDLIVGTHGRSLYKASVKEVQKLKPRIFDELVYLFDLEEVKFSSNWGRIRLYRPSNDNQPEFKIPIYSKEAQTAQLEISKNDLVLYKKEVALKFGLNYVSYPLLVLSGQKEELGFKLKETEPDFEWPERDDDSTYLPVGEYQVAIKVKNTERTGLLKIKK